jgi:hypothetical protein
VLFDSVGKYSRIGDAQRIRDWLEAKRFGAEKSATASKPLANVVGSEKPI